MTIHDIVMLYEQGKVPDDTFYSYTFGLNKFKILSVYTKKGCSMFAVDCTTGFACMLDGSNGHYFLTPQAAIDDMIECNNKKIKKDLQEIESLKQLKLRL